LRQISASYPANRALKQARLMSSVPTVFARSVRKVADAVAARGNIHLLLGTIGLDQDAIADPTLRIPYADLITISEHAARMASDAAFGLHVGERVRLESYGAVGYSIMTSSTVAEALRSQVELLPIWTDSGSFRLDVDGPTTQFQWAYSAASLPESRHDCEMTMATVARFLRLLTSARWKPREVWFRHKKPKDASEHERAFRAPVRFGMPGNALLFDSRLLSAPIRSANPHAHRVITDAARQLAACAPDVPNFTRAVLSLIRQGLHNGNSGLDAVSRRLAVSRRTLQRRLNEESSSHRELVQQARWEFSRFLIASLPVSTVEAAYALGFSEPSAFYHAFREWFGISPQAYRRAARIH
jgi:AraC-like DNA-binding protein